MKLICTYEEPLKGQQRLFPRDIRNYINSIIPQEQKELKEFFAWHEKKTPPVIYTMPNRKSFAILTYKKDKKTKEFFDQVIKLIKENTKLSFAKTNVSATIKEVFTVKQDYCRFQNGFTERKLRTPLMMSDKRTYHIAKKASSGDVLDVKEIEGLARETIKRSIVEAYRDWFGKEFNEELMEDIMIMFKNDLEYHVVKYKEGEYFPAIRGTIVSNVELPDFIGYKIGMGYGELMGLKEMQRRGL